MQARSGITNKFIFFIGFYKIFKYISGKSTITKGTRMGTYNYKTSGGNEKKKMFASSERAHAFAAALKQEKGVMASWAVEEGLRLLCEKNGIKVNFTQ